METLEDCLPPAHGLALQISFFFLSGTPQIQRVMTMMIRDHEVLFPKSKDAPLSPPAPQNDPKKPPVARSSVGWDATEDPPISRTDSVGNVVRCKKPSSFHPTLPSVQVIPCRSCSGLAIWGVLGDAMAVDAAGIDSFECILKAWHLSKSSFCWYPGDEISDMCAHPPSD